MVSVKKSGTGVRDEALFIGGCERCLCNTTTAFCWYWPGQASPCSLHHSYPEEFRRDLFFDGSLFSIRADSALPLTVGLKQNCSICLLDNRRLDLA